jgi:hypothetical protein
MNNGIPTRKKENIFSEILLKHVMLSLNLRVTIV